MTGASQSGSPEEGSELPVRPVLFYSLAFAIAWAAWAPLVLHKLEILQLPLPFPIVLFVGQSLGAFAPLLSLVVIERITTDKELVKQVFSRLQFSGLPIYWYLLPAVTPISITVLVTVVSKLVSGDDTMVLRPEPLEELSWGLLAVIPFQFVMGLIGSPLGEEPGWRGYILDRYARRGHALAASVLVACLWWVWHVPLLIVLGVKPDGYSFLSLVGHSLLIDSFFLTSKHNLFVAMLCHQGINTTFLFFVSKAESWGGSLALLLISLTIRAWAHKTSKRAPIEEHARPA